MSIHKEGRRTLLVTLVVLFIIHAITIKYFTLNKGNYAFFVAATLLFYAWLVLFFRNPKRTIIPRAKCVLSPADGRVINIQKIYEKEYFKGERIQISIFMSPFNVHVNRYPIAGIIKFFKHHPGKYLIACHPKSSTKNEHTTIVVANSHGVEILFRQIAGFVARRIKTYVKEGSHIQQGAECGFIKFGSRADIFLPLDAKLNVNLGDKVQGGLSVLAELQ